MTELYVIGTLPEPVEYAVGKVFDHVIAGKGAYPDTDNLEQMDDILRTVVNQAGIDIAEARGYETEIRLFVSSLEKYCRGQF